MAFKPESAAGPVRDKTYPSQIAAERPMMAPRIHCAEPPDIAGTLRGGEKPMHTTERHDEFNRALREGLGIGRSDNNDE